MEILPYIGLGDYLFSDDFKTIELKLKNIDFEIGERLFMDFKCKTIFIEKYGLLITFKEDNYSVDCFEITEPIVTYKGISILHNDFEFLKKLLVNEGNQLIENIDGFRSDKVGIGVYCDLKKGELTKRPTSIIIYSKGHYDEKIDLDDIIKYYLNDRK